MSEAAIKHAYDATSAFFLQPEERLRYINRQMAIMDYQSGIDAAEERGEKRMMMFLKKLKMEGRDEDINRMLEDENYRKQLYLEFRL